MHGPSSGEQAQTAEGLRGGVIVQPAVSAVACVTGGSRTHDILEARKTPNKVCGVFVCVCGGGKG